MLNGKTLIQLQRVRSASAGLLIESVLLWALWMNKRLLFHWRLRIRTLLQVHMIFPCRFLLRGPSFQFHACSQVKLVMWATLTNTILAWQARSLQVQTF